MTTGTSGSWQRLEYLTQPNHRTEHALMRAPEPVEGATVIIEADVPIPPRGKVAPRYPIVGLEVGESFEVSGPPRLMAGRLASASEQWKRKLGRAFVIRQTEKGARIWRTK